MKPETETRLLQHRLQNAERRIPQFIADISRLSNQVIDLQNERDGLVAEVRRTKNELRQKELIHIGYTNHAQVKYVTEGNEEAAIFPDTEHECYIPVYMLNIHAHRVGPDSKTYCQQLKLSKENRELTSQNAELVAQVEQLKKRILAINEGVDEFKAMVGDAIVEAGRAGFVAGYSKGWNDYAGTHGFRREELADEYAAKVREGGE